jgi:AraC-like DNA-binding protein
MGMNLREYVNRLRITIADNIKKENPNITLSEIAERVGYNSWVTFYRAYNRYSTNKTKS